MEWAALQRLGNLTQEAPLRAGAKAQLQGLPCASGRFCDLRDHPFFGRRSLTATFPTNVATAVPYRLHVVDAGEVGEVRW